MARDRCPVVLAYELRGLGLGSTESVRPISGVKSQPRALLGDLPQFVERSFKKADVGCAGAVGLGHFSMSDFFLHGVHFVDRDTGWIVGKLGYILGTSDGGKTWDTQLETDGGRLSSGWPSPMPSTAGR